MNDNRPIGFLDSGVGGAAVLHYAAKALENESFIYFGDNKNAPYGVKSKEEIRALTFNCAHFLEKKGVKAIVVACNTATSAAIEDIRSELKMKVVSMEPAIKPALQNAKDGSVIMMATPATCKLERYVSLRERLDKDGKVIDVGCFSLVEQIEKGEQCYEVYQKIFDKLLENLHGSSVDGIVLGCTHFRFIKSQIERYFMENFIGKQLIYDGIEGTVRQLKKVLEKNSISASKGNLRHIELYTSGDAQKILPKISMLRKLLD